MFCLIVLAKVATIFHQLREYNSIPTPVFYSAASVTSLSGSDWLNGFIQANCAGEILGLLPHQMFINCDTDRSIKNRRVVRIIRCNYTAKCLLIVLQLFSYTGLVEKSLTVKERLELHRKKEEAVRSKLQKHEKLELTEEEMEKENYTLDDLNPHYYCYEPITYQESDDKYGLVFCDLKPVS